MKKILALILVAICLTSCGEFAVSSVGIDALSEAIVSSLDFDDDLAILDDEVAFYIHDAEDLVKDVAVYIGTGATAEEVAVFEAKNKASMSELKEEIAEYIADKRDEYEDYVPEEVARINKAVIREDGNYLVLCINKDPDKVNQLLNSYFKGEE